MEVLKKLQEIQAESDKARSMIWKEGDKYMVAVPVKGEDYPMPDYTVGTFPSLEDAVKFLDALGLPPKSYCGSPSRRPMDSGRRFFAGLTAKTLRVETKGGPHVTNLSQNHPFGVGTERRLFSQETRRKP